MDLRRIFLSATLLALTVAPLPAQRMRPRDVDALPASKPTLVDHYGTDPLQIAELRLPAGRGPFPVAVVIHGGCWTKGYATLRNTAPLASELVKKGIATWNIEYRQVGDAGAGWPGTFLDWASAVDRLRHMAESQPLDLEHVVVIGHSAGAHAALWVAARARLPRDSAIYRPNPLRVLAAVAIDGPGDLSGFVGADAQICGKPVVAPLMGGTPEEVPARYEHASPQSLLPLGVPQFLIAASAVLPAAKANAYQARAQAAGDSVEVLALDSGHFEVIAPGQPAWASVEEVILSRAFKLPGASK